MSYTPTEWKNGDIITAEKMNKIQEAIENLPDGGDVSNVYMVPGDYADGDTIDTIDLNLFRRVIYDINGLGFILINVDSTSRIELFVYTGIGGYCITNPEISAPTISDDGTISFN